MSRAAPASRSEISECVRRSLDRYFRDLDGEKPCAIYDMGPDPYRAPMLEVVMREADGNQTVAADMLGINRNTLRRKLVEHKLL
ncbi:MAG: Fis family transcriptional regulator [Rhodocyclaceae bacterium]|nr:Fis family transcriptional regulator [Rhodocyclaceae bacterium]